MPVRSSSGSHPSCLARRALDLRRSELLDAEFHRAAEIDVRDGRRANAAQPVALDWDTVSLGPLDHLVHMSGVPGQHNVCQQDV